MTPNDSSALLGLHISELALTMAENTIINMYTTTTGVAAANIDMPDDGVILAVILEVSGTLNADTEDCSASVEFGSTRAGETNDARSVIATKHVSVGMLTSGAMNASETQRFDFGEDGIKVFGGERIYLHTAATGGALDFARAQLLCRFQKFVARRR